MLSPRSASYTNGSRPWRSPWIVDFAIVTIAIVTGTFYREPYAFMRPQFWAEDGTILFLQSYVDGWAAILRPYAGYFELYQRLVAAVVALLSVRLAPAGYLVGNVIAQLVVGWLCLSPRLPMPRWARIAAGAAVTLAPAQNEVFNTLINSQWILALAPLVVLAYDRPRTRGQAALDLVVVLLAGLSGPFSVIYLPLFLAKAVVLRSRWHAWSMFAANLACAFVQSRHMAYSRTEGAAVASVEHLRVVNGVFGHIVAGRWGRPAPESPTINGVLFCSVILFVAVLAYRACSAHRGAALLFLAAGVSVVAATLYAFRSNPTPLVTYGNRYWYIPTVTVVWTVLALWDHTRPALRQPGLTAVLLLATGSFLQDAQTATSASFDLNWPEASRCIGTQHPCVVPLNPPGWSFTIP